MADSENSTTLPPGWFHPLNRHVRFTPVRAIVAGCAPAEAITLVLDRAEIMARTPDGDEVMMIVLKPAEVDALAAIGAEFEDIEDDDPAEDDDPDHGIEDLNHDDDDPAGGNVEDEWQLGRTIEHCGDFGENVVPLHRQAPDLFRRQVATLPTSIAPIQVDEPPPRKRRRSTLDSALFTRAAPEVSP